MVSILSFPISPTAPLLPGSYKPGISVTKRVPFDTVYVGQPVGSLPTEHPYDMGSLSKNGERERRSEIN